MPDPNNAPWIDPALHNFARMAAVQGHDKIVEPDNVVETIAASAIAPLRGRWADEARAVKEAGNVRNARKRNLDDVRQKVAALKASADRLAELRAAATKAADEAARLHAESLVKHGGKQTTRGR